MAAEDDLPGRMGELLRYGTIESIDLAGGRIAVRVGEIVTSNLRWIQGAAGDTSIWIRPKPGEQILLLAPDGDLEGAIAMRGIVSSAFPPIGDEARDVIRFADGTEIAYGDSGELEAKLAGDGKATVTAAGGVKIVGPVEIEGTLKVTEDASFDAKVTAQDEVEGKGIKLSAHKHGNVQAGGAKTGTPE